jgi:hypothetical protein
MDDLLDLGGSDPHHERPAQCVLLIRFGTCDMQRGGSMKAKPGLFQTALGAFLLQEDAYSGMRDDAQRIKRALILVVVVGLLVGVTGACGRLGEWALSPNMDAMKAVILRHLTQMPWYAEMSRNPRALEIFRQQYDLGWNIAKVFAPSPSALIGIVTTPLSLLIVWLIYGVLAHLSARILGGKGSAGQTLACTALAVAPQLLNVVTVLPFAQAAGVSVWTLVCNFAAIRSAHGLSGWRALAAALLPLVLAILVGAVFACVGGALIGPMTGRLAGGAQ